ncbi:uncharacterized protein N7503_000210 [Penicillium pulvis]|uniref:uncharacterized protein n=1 Tax=Penicillium pulvis TaxID=1562058 RepID=UPI0025489DEF|nr:uncharacterized protein N7503_000210 [Penicillium pulvis]KAJ5813460.1 hypothetical protein N7503_000210 [Penicillium pulvis]
MKRWATEESLAEDRPGRRPVAAADTAQSYFHGHGLQNSGNGNVTVGRDFNLGNWTDKRFDCQRDLFVTNPSEDRKALRRRKGGHASGSCEWILHTKELTTWLGSEPTVMVGSERQPAQALWLHGNPGTGKSTMAIFLTEELPKTFSNMNGETLVYFFCDSGFDKQRTATSVVRGLLHQLIEQHDQLLDYLLPRYHERGIELFKSFDALWEIFMTMVDDQNTGRKYCIIDALDECDGDSQKILLAQLEETVQSQDASSNFRLLVTSRPYSEIRESLQIFTNKDLASFPERQEDINLFIEEKVNYLAERKGYTNKVKNRVSQILKDKAEGTFLWIGIACNELKDIPSNRVINVLKNIPKGLDSLYKTLLDMTLEQNDIDDIRRLLSCIAVCLRPLTVSELSEACQLYQEEEDFETRLQFTREYIESYRLMIIIKDEKVLLLHKSVKDYLIGAFFIQKLEAHAQLAYRCVDLLLEPFCSANESHTGFSKYAIFYWTEHARMAEFSFKVQRPQAEFFQIDSPYRERWLEQVRSEQASYPVPERFSIFHVAAIWGVSALVDFALGLGAQGSEDATHAVHINCIDSAGKTPLEYAAKWGDHNIVAVLLSQGGKITTQVVEAATGNLWHGKEVMTVFLNHYEDHITITDELVGAAALNPINGKEVMALILDRNGDQTPINEIIKAAAEAFLWKNGILEFLLDRYGDQVTIADELVMIAAGNPTSGGELMAILLDRYGDQITVTNELVMDAAINFLSGKEIMSLLLDRYEEQIVINDVVKEVIRNPLSDKVEVLALLLDRCGDQRVINEVVKEVFGNCFSDKLEVIALLLDRYGDYITMTHELVKAAAGDPIYGKEVKALLLDRYADRPNFKLLLTGGRSRGLHLKTRKK